MLENKKLIQLFARFLYLFMVTFSFYLLFTSRSGEVYTVWQVLNPYFLPAYFAATFILLTIILSSEKTSHKLLFIILHSILTNSLFIIIFPAGDISGQQTFLGRTRLIYENIIFNGWPPTTAQTIPGQIYNWIRGTNFQAALTVTFSRMFAVDVFWAHLLLVPILWGTFIPTALFMLTKVFTKNENVSILSSLLISIFPLTIMWGSISVANSIGYLFFSCSLIFFLKYLSSNDPKTIFLIGIFSLASFLGHALTGILSFSILALAVAFRKYEEEKERSPTSAKALLPMAFLFGTSLLPMSLVYLKWFYPIYTYFTIDKLHQLSSSELVSSLIFGGSIEFELSTVLIHIMAPLLGLASIIYVLLKIRRTSNRQQRMRAYFLFTVFLMFLVDHRILKLLMTGVPFAEGRLFMCQYFVVTPFLAVITYDVMMFLRKKLTKNLNALRFQTSAISTVKAIKKAIPKYLAATALLIMYVTAFVLISGWITLSLYRAYPHYGPLQTTTYELEAVKYIEKNTTERYVVICDSWMIYAGEMLVGIHNPRAFYFSSTDPHGVTLFIHMKTNPTNETLTEALEYNNATVAYFIIEKPRLGSQGYNRIKSQALQNGLQTYQTFYHGGEEKLTIFYYTHG